MKKKVGCSPEIWKKENGVLHELHGDIAIQVKTEKECLKDANMIDPYAVDDHEKWHESSGKHKKIDYHTEKIAHLQGIDSLPYYARMDITDGHERETYYFGESGYTPEHTTDKYMILSDIDDEAPLKQALLERLRSKSVAPITVDGEKYVILSERHIEIKDGKLIFVTNDYEKDEGDEQIVTDAFLIRLLQQRRSEGRDGSIIMTIQEKQYAIMKAPYEQNLVVQGVAGAGKTQVMLSRLSYLMRKKAPINWDDALIITPNAMYQNFSETVSYQLFHRYHLQPLQEKSLTQFYVSILEQFDQDFSKRKYKVIHSEELLPDGYLRDVYAQENIKAICESIVTGIRQELLGIKLNCTKAVFEQYKLTDSLEQLYAGLTRAIDNALESITGKEKRLESESKYRNRLREEKETLQRDLQAAIKSEKKVENAFQKQVELNNTAQEPLQRYLRVKSEYAERISASEERLSDARLALNKSLDRFVAVPKMSAEERAVFLNAHLEKERFVKTCEEELQQAQAGLKAEMDAAIVMLLPLIGNVTVEEWQDEQIKQLQQKQTVYNEAAERRKTIETRLQTIDSILPQDIDDGTKIDDEPSELRKAKRLLGRLETTIFEKSVEPQLQSIKRDYHVVDIYREARQDSGSVRFRVIYKSELQFHLFIFYQLFGCAKVRDASFLCIDEGQDLSSFDYSLLSILQPKAIKNIYGDIGQVLHDGAGIRNWNNIEFSEYKQYELIENYRNSEEIVDFCNSSLHMNMVSYGAAEKQVRKLSISDGGKFIARQKHDAAKVAIIVKSHAEYEQLLSGVADASDFVYLDTNADSPAEHKINVYSIYAIKGLEFESVFVVLKNLNRNQRYVAYTRAMQELTVIE